jgi:hypothetical protein
VTRAGLSAVAALALAGAAAGPASSAPVVDQMVVFRSGKAVTQAARTDATRVRAGRRRCRVPRATPLAALVRSQVAALRVRDYSGACDPSTLFVTAIDRERNRGQRGWVYKVGNRLGSTAASDPSGPFGSGRLKRRVRITWFYSERTGQRTLGLRLRDEGDGRVTARVSAYDDDGRGTPAKGATVRNGATSATTDARGVATLELSPGTHRLHAEQRGAIRSFDERVRVG